MVSIGNALGTSLLLYFLMFQLDDEHAEDDLIILTLIYMVFVILASLGLGRLSDRLGRRKAFVFLASGLQGVAALLLAIVPDLSVAMVAAGLLGLGYGCFLSVDQALATQVLPDAATRGQDLGIMNIASAVPQAIAPLIGAAAVLMTGSFVLVFVLSAVFAFGGALAVARVRRVRRPPSSTCASAPRRRMPRPGPTRPGTGPPSPPPPRTSTHPSARSTSARCGTTRRT
jgi:MFS family permease